MVKYVDETLKAATRLLAAQQDEFGIAQTVIDGRVVSKDDVIKTLPELIMRGWDVHHFHDHDMLDANMLLLARVLQVRGTIVKSTVKELYTTQKRLHTTMCGARGYKDACIHAMRIILHIHRRRSLRGGPR